MYVQVDGAPADVTAGARARARRDARGDRRGGTTGRRGYEVESEPGRDVRRDLARAVVAGGWGLLELRPMRMSLEEIFLQLTTEEQPQAPQGEADGPMSNILAIARKELRGYFASPIGYVVIGLFALLFGYFFAIGLNWFVRQSMQAPQMGGGAAEHQPADDPLRAS